jgi:hypothetical protein
MTLTEATILLQRHRIPYQTARYESEADYWRHLTAFPDTTHARKCKVTALVIPALNGAKDIELQFNRLRGEYVFNELWFGGYGFEMFDHDPELLEADLMDLMGRIVDGKLAVIECQDLRRKRWVSGGSFDLSEDDNVFGALGFREAVAKIEKPRTFRQKLTGRKLQYEIYDWRTYRQIVK